MTYKHPWYIQLSALENTTTCELESTPNPQKENLGQKPTKKYTHCKHCGAETRALGWHTTNQYWIHFSECQACRNFKNRHGFTLTPKDREFLGEPKCAICGTTEGTLCIDHCHTTNKIRGWLCGKHNRGISYFGEDTQLMQKATDYLSTHA
jgi:ribosomal protein S14